MYTSVRGPFAETYQNNSWNTAGQQRLADRGPRRSAPVELPYLVQKNGRWKQGDRRIRNVRPKMYFVRPSDGKRSGSYGRLMDGLSGEGVDVFVSKCGDKRTLMRDRPQRWQWSGWGLSHEQRHDLKRYDKDYRKKDLRAVVALPINFWSRWKRPMYDFKSRKYEHMAEMPHDLKDVWTDARWAESCRRNDTSPLYYRDGLDQWYSRIPDTAGNFAGGRPRSF